MASAPTTARVVPTGIKLDDGYKTTYAFARRPNVNLWEKSVRPPGIDGGDGINTSTMHNNGWRTFALRHLKTLTEGSFTAAYDPGVLDDLAALINVNDGITCHYPDGTTQDFWGGLRKAEFGDLKDGDQPEGTFTILPTNWDPVNKVEAGPVITSVAGT